MRSCLKHPSPSPSPANSPSIATPPPTRDPTPPLIPPDVPSLAAKRRPAPSLIEACLTRRCVHFCSELVDKVFVADEWDRSPAEATPRLTYQDMLELKEIQRSLPHAIQPFDDPDLPELNARGVPRTHFLNTVPVGLVPLINPSATTCTSSTSQPRSASTSPSMLFKPKMEYSAPQHSPPSSRPPPSPPSTPPPPHILVTSSPHLHNMSSPKLPSPPTPPVEPWVPPPPPPRLPYNIPIQPRPVPRFNFLPLLETSASPSPGPDPHSQYPRLPHSQDLPKASQGRTPSPPASSSSPHSLHLTGALKTSSFSSIGISPSATLANSDPLTASDRPPNPLTAQLFPPSPASTAPSSPGDGKDAPLEDSAHLEAELSRLWRGQLYNTDGETETEESETESSVVHTEAESDGESTYAVVAPRRALKVTHPPVAVATATDADDDEGEMSLVELESGVITFVRVPRRR